MTSLELRAVGMSAIVLMLAACGAHDGSPVLPNGATVKGAAAAVPSSGVGSAQPTGIVMEASVGSPPAGFSARFRAQPQPGADGVIRGDSPLTVTYDMCGSTADGDKELRYLYDWDFDNVADLVGTGEDCKQQHTYRVPRNATAGAELGTNICVVNADPRAHAPKTFFSCRTYKVSLAAGPRPVSCPASGSCGANDVSFNGHCYYLDGSQGACDSGYSLASQQVLDSIAPCFEGLDYKHTVSGNCCIYNADADEDWGMQNGQCNQPGPFRPGSPARGAEGCTDQTNFNAGQLTLCGK